MSGWRQRYSKKEAFNRIARAFQVGNVVANDVQGAVPGELLSENQAVSDFAEVLNDSLPGETPTVPDAIRASVAEALAGTNDTKAVTPLGLAGAVGGFVEHGHMWVSTGTATQSLSTSWVKPTGIFTDNGLSSTNVTPDYTNDRITVSLPGTYLVVFQTSLVGAAGYTVKGAVYM